MREGQHTPWGPADNVKELIPGIHWVGTAGHGGIFVERHLWETMPHYMKTTPYSQGGFFEEDSDWCLPFIVFESELAKSGDAHTRSRIERRSHIDAFGSDPYHNRRREMWALDHNKPRLAETPEEATRILYGGRSMQALRHAKHFDGEALQDSPLFKPTIPTLFDGGNDNAD